MLSIGGHAQVYPGLICIRRQARDVAIPIAQMHLPGGSGPVNAGHTAQVTGAAGTMANVRPTMQQQKAIQLLGIGQVTVCVMPEPAHQSAMNPSITG
jgi:hypothetical protein